MLVFSSCLAKLLSYNVQKLHSLKWPNLEVGFDFEPCASLDEQLQILLLVKFGRSFGAATSIVVDHRVGGALLWRKKSNTTLMFNIFLAMLVDYC